jgi:hypothetical protein
VTAGAGRLLAAALSMGMAMAGTAQAVDIQAMFKDAAGAGRVGAAAKTQPVDVRPARPGEVVVTLIEGEGVETRSKPAEAGDMVVRNRCPATGDEAYLVKAAKIAERYQGPLSAADADGWSEYRPRGKRVGYFVLGPTEGPFSFTALWGEAMMAKPGDAIVQDPADPADTYRVAAASFACTYEVQKP